jgi:cell division protein FtsB
LKKKKKKKKKKKEKKQKKKKLVRRCKPLVLPSLLGSRDIIFVAGACLGASLVMRVFAYALPTFRLRGAYAGELLYFRILAMQTSRLETLQKRERNSSISFCFSAKQLLSSNYL